MSDIRDALRTTFQKRIYFLYFFLGTVFMTFLYVYIPIFVTPGNDLAFFLETTPFSGLMIIFMLAALMGILISMQIYVWSNFKVFDKGGIGSGLGAGFSSLIAGLFSTATCAACLSAVLAFLLPSGGILFLLEHRWWFVAGGFILVGLSLHLVSKQIVNGCNACNVVVNE